MKIVAVATLALAALVGAQSADAASCVGLARLRLPGAQVMQAAIVRAGAFQIDAVLLRDFGGALPGASNLPDFCRVVARMTPSADSDIRIEVWMPVSGWNGKFEGVGNGGWAGHLKEQEPTGDVVQVQSYFAMVNAVLHGYAAAATDTGHVGDAEDASFALGHPERVVDFAYRAVHQMTTTAKRLVAAFYGRSAARAYWYGCSTGGMQGLMEAQRFPDDYDAIAAGAPANNWTHLMAGDVWLAQATHATPASEIPPTKYPIVHKAALDACDAADGVRDGVIADPTACRFDPGVLLCKQGDGADCLTAPQVEAARKIYAGARNPRTGEQVFPGLEPGSEMQWAVMAGGPEPPIVASFFKYLIFKNPAWDFRTLNFDRDVARADAAEAKLLNATNPDLDAFTSRGGKLLLYHGWSDGLIAPENSVNYYESVLNRLRARDPPDGVRLFMIPGMGHCGDGDGPHQFDQVAALDEWVNTKKAPQRIVATARRQGKTTTRPLCAYPSVPTYSGHGSTDDAASFV
ncbi:MAG: tannase/feruloyl esterase family alpha/beta hydrolase, partial [Betaproteobacteria bacterium]